MFPEWSDARIWQAIVAGLFVAAGWVVNGWQNRREAERLRRHRLRDLHRALFAEIKHNLVNLGDAEALRLFGERVVARIEADDFVPFVPRERNDRVFATVLPDIHILPRVSVDPIIRYYSQLAAHDALVEDMRGQTFRRMDAHRRADLYADFIAVKIRMAIYARQTLDVIDAYASGGTAAARKVVDAWDPIDADTQ